MTTVPISSGINEPSYSLRANRPTLIGFAYATLLISISVHGFWSALVPADKALLGWVQAGLLLALYLIATVWRTVRPLRGFVLVSLAANILGSQFIPLVKQTGVWSSAFGVSSPTFVLSNLGDLLLKLVATFIMIGLLLAMGLRRRDFYLVKGQLDAPASRIRWLPGTKDSDTWVDFGKGFSIITFSIILALMLLMNLPRLGSTLRPDLLFAVLPLLPVALLFAGLNAFHEEVVLRAAPLSQLVPVLGPRHALFMTILSFGLGHFVGALPDGFVGIALTSFFAYVMGKAMLETRGIVWPWICHFAADAAVFSFVAVLAVAAGTV